jgi:two-component system, chemotaxis family, CheB/CheR fusion protein
MPEPLDEAVKDSPGQTQTELEVLSQEVIVAQGSAPSTDHPEENADSGHLPFAVVAIGGSAGGVEAYIELFQNLPADTGFAYVVVSHLAPTHKSHLAQIIRSRTSMPVMEIQHHTRPEPNQVYVIPPNAVLTIRHGFLELGVRADRFVMTIDGFFRSLAADQKNRAIGVVLSGMDSDGALGLRAIKGEGGISIVQAPESARFPDMPSNSIEADHVDLVAPPADIGRELARLGSQFVRPELQSLEEGLAIAGQEQQFTRILNLLSGVSTIDFRGYKPATLRRRIARRMLLKHLDTLPEYLQYLQLHGEELQDLQEDVLIGVTRFFRDPEVFDILKSAILPRILENRENGQQVRIWVAGCATGEEVYSIAITLLEYLSSQPIEPPIQIFGTDASENSIQKARLGIFPDSLAKEISAERLRRFFLKVDKGYQVAKRVRDLCIFARQNLCHDPPFGHIDLVSCRNVLIYLGQDLQRRVVPTFHYALRPDGFLLLGNSETIHTHFDLFALLDRKHKFYRKLPSPTHLSLDMRSHFAPLRDAAGDQNRTEAWSDIDLQRSADRIVLARYGPPGVIVNEDLEILQSRGHTALFLEMAQGATSLHLSRMLREPIAAQVHDAVRRAIDQDTPVHLPRLSVAKNEGAQGASLEVLPMHTGGSRPRCFLVLFPPAGTLAGRDDHSVDELVSPPEYDRFAAPTDDLTVTKLYLRSLIEERDARNQELVSANEEIQSANEELQSANEELETTKEELQSSNEELQTVNEELQQRNSILAQTSNDLTNLLNSVNLPLLMLNNDLQIRQFTPLTQRLMNVRPSDIGRSISEIRLNLSVENLEPLLLDVLDSLGTRELEVQDRDGHWRLLRVRPYRTADNKIEGVVLVLMDIDELRRSQQELLEARDYARSVIESIKTPTVVLNTDLKIRTVNGAFRTLASLPAGDSEGRSFPDLAVLLWGLESVRERLSGLVHNLADSDSLDFEHQFEQGQETRFLHIWARALATDGEQIILLTFEDITAPKITEHLHARLNRELEVQVHSTEETLGRTQSELRALAAKLFASQEEERRRVARELHDDISQQLAHLQMELERIQIKPPANADELSLKMEHLHKTAAHLSDNVRAISHRLHPSILEDLGLAEAIKSLLEEFRGQEGMLTTFRRHLVPASIPYETVGALYRIAQEALRNVAKHAGKTHVKITLEGTGSGVRLKIKDFGEGFDMQEKSAGLGLISMAERARLVQGAFSVESALGAGATITVEVPLSPEARH